MVDITEHLQLVHWVISRTVYKSPLDYDELLSAGYLGLVIAGQKFDPERGFAFSTYATHVIRSQLIGVIRKELRVRERFMDVWDIEDVRCEEEDVGCEEILENPVLTTRQRHVLKAIFVDGKPQRVVAKELGVSKQAISLSKYRALSRLRDVIDFE